MGSPQPSHPGIEAIRAPSDVPADVEDERSRGEEARYARRPGPTPTQKLDRVNEDRVKDLQAECERLHDLISAKQIKCDGWQASNEDLHRELSMSQSELARVRQISKTLRIVFGFGTVPFGVGGSLISHFATNSPMWACLGWGLVLASCAIGAIVALADR